nr:MAG TPA: hypothetical protein [Caudoviricetes sp.]
MSLEKAYKKPGPSKSGFCTMFQQTHCITGFTRMSIMITHIYEFFEGE